MNPTPAETPSPHLRPLFISPREAAGVLGLSRSEVYRLLDTGVIDSRRHGTRRLVLVTSLHDYASNLLAS